MTVRYADMNGNGSTDILWSTQSGALTYIELFPERPNLLSHLSNGLGKVTEVAYRSAVQYLATVGAWDTRLRMSMTMVEELDEYDTFSAVHKVRRMTYSNPYFDGEEKAFRGFADVEAVSTTADGVEDGTERFHYDVGMTDPYLRGKLLGKATESEGRRLQIVENRYAECALAGVPNTDPPIRFICQTAKLALVQEGAPQDAWVMLEERYEYDGFGNRTLEANLGITSIGLQACAPCAGPYSGPCGPRCLGDERYTEMTFIPPGVATGGRWVLRKPSRKSVYGVPGSGVHTEEISYYDGDPFVGLAEGQLDVGLVSRTTAKIAAGSTDVVATTRTRHGPHGNVVEELDPNGHRTTLEYDADGLLLTGEIRHLDAAGHPPYAIRIAVTLDPVLELPTESTGWVRWQEGAPVSPERTTAYGFDQFGRLISVTKPGESTTAPTEEFVYRVGAPVSAVETLQRSASGGPADLYDVWGYDERGRRIYQARTVGTATFELTSTYDAADRQTGLGVVGGPQVVYVLDRAGRALSVPGYIASIAYDERGRLEEVQAQNGVRTVNAYGPTMALDSITTTSPTTELLQSLTYVRDRLGRVVTVEDGAAEPGAPSASATYSYDALGRLTVAVLEPGRSREETITYEYDGPGRLLARRSALGAASPAHLGTYEYGTSPGHPGAPAKVGPTDLRYDEAGNLIQRGPVRFEWNHQSRLIAAWRGNERLFVAGFAADLDRVKKVERGQTTYYLGPDVEVRDGMVILTMRINGQRVVRLETEALAASALSDLAPGGGPDGRITAADALLAHRAGGASGGGSGADVPPWHQALASAARRQSSGAPEVATYWHGDHLGTVSVSTDESAQLRQRSLHYPFGALRHSTYHISEEYGFGGLEQDYGTGDLHAKARNYSPDMGIWLKPDPKFLAIDGEDLEKSLSAVLSRYAYASDDPANRTDPSGLEDVGSWEALRGSGMPPKALEQMAGALIEDTVTKGQSILGGQLDFSTHGYQVQLSARAYGLRKVLETADATYTVTIGEASASFSNYNTPAASAAVVTMERKSKDEFAIIKSVKVSLITASTGGMVKLKMEAPSWSKHAGKSVSLSPGSPGEVKLGFSKVGIGNISVTVSASNFMRKYKKDRVRDHRKTKSWLPPRG